jgi:hypothetical protein
MSAILTVPFKSEEQIKGLVRSLSQATGKRIRPRGRHSNRKAVLGNWWRKHSQNDIPWRLAERVSFYIVK